MSELIAYRIKCPKGVRFPRKYMAFMSWGIMPLTYQDAAHLEKGSGRMCHVMAWKPIPPKVGIMLEKLGIDWMVEG
jgi:hypothetical protein